MANAPHAHTSATQQSREAAVSNIAGGKLPRLYLAPVLTCPDSARAIFISMYSIARLRRAHIGVRSAAVARNRSLGRPASGGANRRDLRGGPYRIRIREVPFEAEEGIFQELFG